MPVHSARGRPPIRLIMAGAAVGLFLIGYYWGNQYKHDHTLLPTVAAVLVRPPIALPDLDLREASGQPFTTEGFDGHWTLLSFDDPGTANGLLAITRLVEVRNLLADHPDLRNLLRLALVSQQQDPAPNEKVAGMSPTLEILIAPPGKLQELRTTLGAPPNETTETTAGEEPFYLIGPSARLLALFTGAQAPASIASDLITIAANAEVLYPPHD
jgi:hypothetical protein